MNDAGHAPLPGVPQPGEVLVGKYRVERLLGVGGMGAVVSATHLQLEEKVAIKFLHAETARNAENVARFLREGKAVIKIRSEHAVKVHDVGRLESGAPYLVMEHLDGSDLNTLLETSGPMAMTDAVDFVLQACEAIAEAHTIGIIHRDLKPANLFLTRRADGSSCVKVLDFGISKANSTATDVSMTKTQAVMGSPRYMSPEQMRSTRAVDARTDVWSIGIILYELLSGQPPFNGESMTELCAQILQDVPAPLPRVLPQIPPGLDAVVQRCLGKDPDQRFPNLAELATALAPFGTAGATASAERIVRVMQARGGVVPPLRPSMPSGASSSSPSLAQSGGGGGGGGPAIGTDPTAVSASQTRGGFGSTGSKSGKVIGVSLVAIFSMVLVGGIVGGALFLKRGHSGATATSAPPAATVPAAATAPPDPVPSTTPSAPEPSAFAAPPASASAAPAATPSPAPGATAIAVSTPATPTAKPAPAPRKHPAPPPTTAPASTAGGMFDGRK